MLGFEQKKYSVDEYSNQFFVLAQQLRLPLLKIARNAELSTQTGSTEQLNDIESTAAGALALLDNYLLALKRSRLGEDNLEPVSISALLHRVTQRLQPVAQQHNCDVELNLAGRYEPIMANSHALEAALISLGYVFIEAESTKDHTKRPIITIAAHRSRWGIVAGLFTNAEGLTTDMYRRAKGLYGKSEQPFTQFTAQPGAGVIIADTLLTSMATQLRIAHHQKLPGLAATFQPSEQLSLI